MIEKAKLPRPLSPDFAKKAWSVPESWRTFDIMSEFVEATERLSEIRPAVGLNIQLPHEQRVNPYQDISQSFRHFFARKVCSSSLL